LTARGWAFYNKDKFLIEGEVRATTTVGLPSSSVRQHPAAQAWLVLRTGFVVAVVAGLVVAVGPTVGGYLVAAWLAATITNLLPLGDHHDLALGDLGLLLAALALTRLATTFQPTPDTATTTT
jgi:hypothetical protein